MIPNTEKLPIKKPRESVEDKDEATTQTLCDLALSVTHNQARRIASELAEQHSTDFNKIIKKYIIFLQQILISFKENIRVKIV